MPIALLKNVVSSVAGPNASKIVDLLYNKKNVNEFLIAKKLSLTINQTRNILYRLADEGLVSFVRKKDSRKGGWYTYFWTLNSGKSLFKFKDKLLANVANLNNQLASRKTKKFFNCINCDLEMSEENALLHDYTCPECGEILQLKDNSAEIANIEKEIVKLNEILNSIHIEIDLITKKDTQSRVRRFKAEEKKKKIERAVKRRKKELEKKKLNKGKEKKVKKNKIKKKVKKRR